MSHNNGTTDQRIAEIESEALEWVIALSDVEQIDISQLKKFEAWRDADPLHWKYFQEADEVWQGMNMVQDLRQTEAETPSAESVKVKTEDQPSLISNWIETLQNWIRQPAGMAGAGFAFVAIIAVLFLFDTSSPVPDKPKLFRYSTEIAQIENITLEDGSSLTLGPQSELRVALSESLRRVQLNRGEALFDVQSNPARPFVVLTGGTETRVVGTKFNIKRDVNEVKVAVIEGRVQVGKRQPESSQGLADANLKLLERGQSVKADLSGKTGEIQSVDVQHIGSWKDGKLVYDKVALKQLVADINRYYEGHIIIADPKVGEERLSITLKTNNFDDMIETLTAVLSLQADRSLPGTIVLKK